LFWGAIFEIPDLFTGCFVWRLAMAQKSFECAQGKTKKTN
jgi:hypothetical protein